MIVLYVLLNILKIIGILLLAIVGLLFLLLAIVLIVPIRYRVRAAAAGEIKTLTGKVQASWMLHLISVKAEYLDQTVRGVIRIAWKKIPIGGDDKTESESVSDTTVEESLPGEDLSPQDIDTAISEETSPENDSKVAEPPPEESSPSKEPQPVTPSPSEATSPKDGSLGERRKEQKQGASETDKTERTHRQPRKKTPFWDKIKAIFQKIKYTFEKICANIKLLLEKKDHLVEQKDRLVEFKDHPAHRNALSVLWKEVKNVLRHLRPKKLKADIKLGFEDPYITGQVLAGLGIAYPFMGKDMRITPDFEKQILQGDASVTGKVRLIHMTAVAIRLLLTKDVRTTYHDIRHFQL